jgi:D-3-phosphoglycerate dehydrogenase
MVELDDFLLDAIPEGRLLITRHRDVPGVIGRVGTLLGEARVNISRLQLGQRQKRQGEAIGVFNVDSEVPATVLSRLRELPEILSLTQVAL